MSQSRRLDSQFGKTFRGAVPMARLAIGVRWWRGRWRSWRAIIGLLPVAGPVAAAAMVLNLVIGVLPLGFVAGTSVAVGRVAGTGQVTWGGILPGLGLAVAALLLQSVLSPLQAAFAELVSRRVDGACARRLMRAALTEAPFGLLEQPDVLDKMGDARRGLTEYPFTPGGAVAGLTALIARYAQLAGGAAVTGVVLGPVAALVITAAALVARFGERGIQARYSVLASRSAPARSWSCGCPAPRTRSSGASGTPGTR